MSEVPIKDTTHCKSTESLNDSKWHSIKRPRTSELSIKKICNLSQNPIDSNSSSPTFMISAKLKEYLRIHFEQSVKRAVDNVLNRLLVYNQTVHELKEETDRLRLRVEKMEFLSEKINSLFAKHSIFEPTISKPLDIVPCKEVHESCSPPIPTFNIATQAVSVPLHAPLEKSPIQTESVLAISLPTSISSFTPPSNTELADVIDLTEAEITPNSVDLAVSSTFIDPVDMLASSNSWLGDYTALQPSGKSFFSTSVSRKTTPVSINNMDDSPPRVSSLAHNSVVAPLPIWCPSIVSADKSNLSSALPVQPSLCLVISPAEEGVSLRWELSSHSYSFEPATCYELYSYASSDVDSSAPLSSDVWQKIGDIEALPLPMICTLTSVISNNIYYFIVRSKDKLNRRSDWSNVVDAHVS